MSDYGAQLIANAIEQVADAMMVQAAIDALKEYQMEPITPENIQNFVKALKTQR